MSQFVTRGVGLGVHEFFSVLCQDSCGRAKQKADRDGFGTGSVRSGEYSVSLLLLFPSVSRSRGFMEVCVVTKCVCG